MKITPLRDMLVLRLLPEPERASPLVRVALLERASAHAEVVAVGPEARDARVGQHVIVSRHQGMRVDLGEPLVLVRESAVLGTLP